MGSVCGWAIVGRWVQIKLPITPSTSPASETLQVQLTSTSE